MASPLASCQGGVGSRSRSSPSSAAKEDASVVVANDKKKKTHHPTTIVKPMFPKETMLIPLRAVSGSKLSNYLAM